VAADTEAGWRARAAKATERFNAWGEEMVERLRELTQRVPGLRQQAQPQNQLGLAMLPQGLALASVQRSVGSTPRLMRCEYHPLSRQADPGLTLRTVVLHEGIERAASFRLVLNPDEYQLHLVESPDVPDSELREAVRWRIRDLIDFPVDEAAIDVFDMPQQPGGSGRETGKMMCVVVARNPVIAQKAAMVNRSGGELDVIDITDLALRNVLALTPADSTGVALLYVEPAYSLILITAEQTLYLSRRIWIGGNELAGVAGRDAQSPEFRRIADALAMELLRSLEYYETHFSRPAVDSLYIAPVGVAEGALHSHLGQALGVQVENLDLNRLLDTAEPLSPEQQARSLLAIGAALRHERATL
jgi:MSHA biogenesis protein MshI